MRRYELLSLALCFAAGCGLQIELRGGPCVNPDEPLCRRPELESRPLALRIYQLRDEPNVRQVLQLPWEGFLATEGIPEGLKPFLASAADTPKPLRPREDFTILSRERLREPLRRVKDTRYLFVVPRGRMRGDAAPLLLIPVSPLRSSYALCFDKYDVYEATGTNPCR